MMKRFALLLLVAVLTVSTSTAGNGSAPRTITPNDFFANAEKYNGQAVKISGVVKHLCHRSFQKLFLSTDNGKGYIRVNIEGSKFDKNLVGKDVTIIGTVKSLALATAKGCDGGKACDDDKKASADGKNIYYISCQSYQVE